MGNPAAVCVLDHYLDEALMQAIAKENNLSETAFALKTKEGHYHLAPYWADRLNKWEIFAYQASERGGTLICSLKGDRVSLSGKACLYAKAELNL